MRILKRIVEMVFIFLVPLMLLLFGLKINKVYDENNNLTSQYLTYENGIFREYKDNLQYKNILDFNNIDSNNMNEYFGVVDNYVYKFDFTRETTSATTFKNMIFLDHKYLFYVDYISGNIPIFGLYNVGNSSYEVQGIYNYNHSSMDSHIYDLSGGSYQITIISSEVGVNYNLQCQFMIIDLTTMFGSGYEPTSVEDYFLIMGNKYFEPTNSTIIDYFSNDLLSQNYEINYTWYNSALVSLSDHLQFNNNYMIQFIFIYVILIMLNLLLWYVFYVPFDMLFGLLLRKLEYYK